MKTHKLALLFLIGLIFSSCDKEVDMVINVQLNPSILTLSDGGNEPMKVKSVEPSSEDPIICYAIQIYENDVPIHYGLFDDVSKMVIALSTNKTYSFKVAAYKMGTGKGLKTMTDTAGVNYFLPNKLPLKNKFIPGDLLKSIDIPSSAVTIGQQKDYNEVDVFYLTKNVTIQKGTSTIDFNLIRMGFGINFKVDGLTNGSMDIYIGNDTLKLNSTVTSTNTIRQFSNSNSFSNILANADTFGDSISINAKWVGLNGTTISANGKYKFLRNYQKTLNIQLNSLTNNISFENWKFPFSGLYLWMPFNGNANDESGNNINGSIFGATLTNDRFGRPNSAYSFNGSSIIKTSKEGITGNKSRTVSCWFNTSKSPSTTFTGNLISYGATPNTGSAFTLCLYSNSTSKYYIDIDIAKSYVLYNSIVNLNTWNMFTATYSNLDGNTVSNIKIYLNGVLLTSVYSSLSPTTTINSSNSTFIEIGGISNNTAVYFTGKIDDVGIWDRALSQEEITDLFNFHP